MTDHLFFASIDDSSPIRQGDIIKRTSMNKAPETEWGVIVTADCDIANNKMGNYLSFVPIVSAREYVETIWADIKVAALTATLCDKARNLIHKADKSRDPNVAILSSAELLSWLKVDGANTILTTLMQSTTEPLSRQLAPTLMALEVLTTPRQGSKTPFERLLTAWRIDCRSISEQRNSIASALDQKQIRDEYVLIPTLPNQTEIGYVILLRDIRTAHHKDVYLTPFDARIDGKSDAFIRTCRFNDALRFAIAQRFARLFFSIGFSKSFEDERSQAFSLSLSEILPVELRKEGES